MKIGVVSNTIEAGGAQRVCLKMIEALKEANHEVLLITLTKTNWTEVQKMMGAVVKPDEETVFLRKNIRGFDAYKPLLAAVLTPRIRRKFKIDLLVNSQADTLPIKSDILYVHYPTFWEFETVDINLKYSKSLFWRIYIAPYKLMHRFFKNYLKKGTLITNSDYSKKAIKKNTDRNAILMYPPVEVKTFSTVAQSVDRQDEVVSVGRYSPEKNYEYILETANHLRNIEFSVVGSLSGEKSSRYYKKLQSKTSRENLANVRLLKSLTLKDLLTLYSRAKIYMHAMKNEHFGISVIEAMAAGLVPVVYRSGGPWEDILKERQGYYGFSYENPMEAATIIKTLLTDERSRKEITKRNTVYVEEFSDIAFKNRFIELINRNYLKQV